MSTDQKATTDISGRFLHCSATSFSPIVSPSSSLSSLRACLGHQQKLCFVVDVFYSYVLCRKGKLSSKTGCPCPIPSIQTCYDISKMEEEQSFENPVKKLHSKHALNSNNQVVSHGAPNLHWTGSDQTGG